MSPDSIDELKEENENAFKRNETDERTQINLTFLRNWACIENQIFQTDSVFSMDLELF